MRPNELLQKRNLLAVDLLSAVAPRLRHNRSMSQKKSERKYFVSESSTDFAPHRRRFGLRVASRQQQLRLVRFQPPGSLLPARPPHKLPLREAFLRQPKSLAVIHQDADRRATSAAEYKQASRKRIGLEFLLAQPGQRVDAFPAIHCFNRHQDPHLRRDLNHADSHIRISPAKSDAVAPFHWIRSLPRGPSNSITHSGNPTPCGGTSSMNAAAGGANRALGVMPSTIRLSLPYSRRNILAVRKTPCSRAICAAEAHNFSGIGK